MNEPNSKVEGLLESINSKLDKIALYLYFSSFSQLKETLRSILDSPEKILVYASCDGKSGIREISRVTGVNPMRVSNYVNRFESYGLVFPRMFKNKKCPQKIVDLRDVGIQVPERLSATTAVKSGEEV
ncbi:MAG: hypothetical protein H3Z53_01225 [archaeon]|nr:hypothetical protein [archaeon]MCP8312984.1 hypothetical protein [archaeon]